MKLFIKFSMACIAFFASMFNPIYGQLNLMHDSTFTIVPEGVVYADAELCYINKRNYVSASRMSNANSTIYKYGKHEHYTRDGENGDWELYNTSYYNYNDSGYLIKDWDVGMGFFTHDNNYTLYFYDEENRVIRMEHYFDNDNNGLRLSGYHEIEYLNDFPDIESSRIYYTEEVDSWDQNTNDWKYVWKIYSGEKRDYTLSKKVSNHYEKKVDYAYNIETGQWDVSGYKYDYEVNVKGLITETLVYKATNETEDKWPLILHVKNLINDNGVVFRSERFNYQGSTPYIERWSNIKWDKHDGSMPISGYAVKGANRMNSARIEYLLISDPSIEYTNSRIFSSEYQNNNSFHYIVTDNTGSKLIDNSYFWDDDYSLQELWQGNDYQMQYYDFDDNNWTIYDHYVRKFFYEGDNVITQRDWHRYTYNEYYLNSNELTLSEHYEYDALTDSEPYKRSRFVYSDYKDYSASLKSVLSDDRNQLPTYYNLQGVVVSTPQAGQLLIRKIGNKVDKIIYR